MKKNSGKKIAIFDFDGTLVDSMLSFAKIASQVMPKYYDVEKKWAFENYLRTSGIPFSEQLEELFPKDANNAFASLEFEETKKITYFERPLFDDVEETFASLSQIGLKLVISSNNFQHLVDEYLKKKTLNVDLALGYKENFAKGAKHFEYVKQSFLAEDHEMIFVGDSIKDGERAYNSNVDFIAKTGIFTREEFLKDFPKAQVIDSLSDLKNLKWM
ncbi:MAG: HAD hydrolase-like protein [Pseudomonadota bacterium]